MNLVVVICAAGVAIISAAGAAVVIARTRMAADDRVAEAVRRLAEGMQETMRDLAVSVDAAQPPPRHEHFVGELAASLDLEEVAQRTLDAARALPGVEAAVIDAVGASGKDLSATLGLAPEEAERTIVRLPENDNLRAVEVTYRYRIDDVDAATAVIRSGVVVPVRADGEPVGSLSAFSRSAASGLSPAEVDELERLAFRAGPALDNARRFAEARQLADLDGLTGLHNRRYFHETLAREVLRAQRYRRQLTLLVLDLDDFKLVNDRIGHLGGDAALAEIADRICTAARQSDVACRVGGDEFAVILPEAGRNQGEQLADRIERAVGARPVAHAGTVHVSAGVAELRPEEDATGLFERADKALFRAKQLGKSRTVAANDA